MATEPSKQWHLDKTFSLSHLFSTISAIVLVVVLASQFNTRLSLVESGLTDMKRDAAEYRADTKQALRDMDSKLDRVLERLK